MRTRGVALDFDGVVVESVGIKDAAFGEIFSHYPEWPQILEYHLAHNATLRFEKFRHIYVSILGREYSADIESTLTARFSELVCEAIVRCPAVPGATRLLAELGGKLPVFLVSKSPDDELAHILLERHLAQYFDRVYAGSWNKPEALMDICGQLATEPSQLVFVGDTYEDAMAAEQAGVRFIGRNSGKSFRGLEVTVVKNLHDVLEIVKS